jgi:malonyl-CoA O-methyltransferase
MMHGPGSSAVTPSMIEPPRVPARSGTVRRQFDARASRFGRHDWVVREISRRMVERLELMRIDVRRIADVGCGAGGSRADLRGRYPHAQWLGFDLSERMLQAAPASSGLRRAWQRLRPLVEARICADAGQLPLADGSVDLVFSNLMLHWHPRPHLVIPEWRRVLRIDGLLMFSCFGPDTLQELRRAFERVEPRIRPMPFIDMHDFGDMMVAAGMATPVMDAEVLTLTYPSAQAALREVAALGGNPRDDRLAHLVSTRRAHGLLDALEARRDAAGRIALTFEVAYGHAWSAAARAPGTTTVAVGDLRRQLAARRPPPQ